ncbi:DUF4153 domain-containing protein [Paenibacillus sp. NPDC058071]|uniref:DUF4153 domain-containing protein n=1 Tax=Paenibacillus sp. NPDC058071 TaxID=3346326 RepID=UPI0036DCF973
MTETILQERIMESDKRRAVIVGLCSAALAILHQYLFYGREFGVSYPLFVLCFYLFMLGNARDRRRPFTLFHWLTTGAVVLLSFTYVWFDNSFLQSLNALAIPILIAFHMTYLLGRNRPDWADPRLLGKAAEHLLFRTFLHWGTAFRLTKGAAFSRMDSRYRSAISKVLIGLGFTVPLLIIVVTLLASADTTFMRAMNHIPLWLGNLSLADGIGRLVWIVAVGLCFFGYVWGYVQPVREDREKQVTEVERPEAPRLDPLIALTVLISVNAVYLLFVSLQFSYLFDVLKGIVPGDRTYAEYARSGFIELVIVAAINFALLIGALLFVGTKTKGMRLVVRSMLYTLVGCTGVMLISAYSRLALYEDVYGYTYTRFLVHAFMIYLALLLAVAGIRIAKEKLSLFRWYIAISLLAYVAINYAGIDHAIASRNIARYEATGKLDAGYLAGLSADAMPLVIRFAEDRYPQLRDELAARREELAARDRSWQAWSWPRFRAERALDAYLD